MALCLATFKKLFPLYEKTAGFAEMKQVIEDILRRQEGQKQIVIHVIPAAVTGVNEHLAPLKASGLADFYVQGDEALPEGACRLVWADGGAVRDAEKLAVEIEAALKDLLAGNGVKAHD